MSKLSPEELAWSRNMQTQILHALDVRGQSLVADRIGVDSSTISRLKEHHLENICNVMAVVGLKVVPADMKCYNREKVAILYTLAKDNLMKSHQVDDFFHDDAAMQIAEGTYKPRGGQL